MLLQVPQPAQPEQPCSGPLSTECFDSEKACVCSPPSLHSQLEDYFIYESQEITQTSSRTKGKLAWTDDRNLAVHQESSNATRTRLLTAPLHSLQLLSSLFLPNSILNQHGSKRLPVPPKSQSLQSTRQDWPPCLSHMPNYCWKLSFSRAWLNCPVSSGRVYLVETAPFPLYACGNFLEKVFWTFSPGHISDPDLFPHRDSVNGSWPMVEIFCRRSEKEKVDIVPVLMPDKTPQSLPVWLILHFGRTHDMMRSDGDVVGDDNILGNQTSH